MIQNRVFTSYLPKVPVRNFAVKTPWKTLETLDLSSNKIQQVVSLSDRPDINPSKLPKVPMQAAWDQPSPVRILSKSLFLSNTGPHYFFGGLPALMQAARKVVENKNCQVVYTNDQQISKTSQSGHQAHVHPSEYSTKDCDITNLVKTFAQAIGLAKSSDPSDLKHYSYLHFNLSPKDILKDPVFYLSTYGSFFLHRIVHTLTSKENVSSQDRWLCDMVRYSLDFHEDLSKKIEAKTGIKTLNRHFRIYWSPNHEGILQKQKIWQALGITCELMKEQEILTTTILKKGANVSVLKVHGDGKFHPQISQQIIGYLESEYPKAFKCRNAKVAEIYRNPISGEFYAVKEVQKGQEEQIFPIKTLFGSPGHDEIYEVDPGSKKEKKLWREVPVSGISTMWLCKISKDELLKRFSIENGNEAQLMQRLDNLTASANLSNLHVTTLGYEINNSVVQLYVRVSQGANFNSYVAHRDDLINSAKNIDQFLIGNWELLSAGTCTRKTDVSNVPEFTGNFVHGLSGIGFSVSAAPFNTVPKPPLFTQNLSGNPQEPVISCTKS